MVYYQLQMDPDDWLNQLCVEVVKKEPGMLIDLILEVENAVVKFHFDGDGFTGFAAMKNNPRGRFAGRFSIGRIGPRVTAMDEAMFKVLDAIRSARSDGSAPIFLPAEA